MHQLDPQTTALILIDLQNGIVAMSGTPYASLQVVTQCAALSHQFHQRGASVIYVRVDLANFLQLDTDASAANPKPAPPPACASELVEAAGFQEGDLLVTKRHWSAFLGTPLEAHLRQHQIKTVVIAGISTNIGVESTARDLAGSGFNLVFAEDAMTALEAGHHQFSVEHIFPRLGRVRTVAQISQALLA